MFFDPQAHFNLVEKTLGTCNGITTIKNRGLQVSPNWSNWEVIVWDVSLRWPSGETLAVQDFYQRRKKEIFREYSFHFMDRNNKCIFRFDTHGESIPLGKACHVHIGETEEILEDGDPRLNGLRLVEIEFLRVHGLVCRHLDGKKMPWEK